MSATAQRSEQLLGMIKQFWLESGGVYGYRKIFCDLRDVSDSCDINRVRRLIRRGGLKYQRGYRKPRYSKNFQPIVQANILDRQFNPTEPNNDFAFEAFQQLRLLTYLKYEYVFICDETDQEFTTQKSLSEKFVAALKANGICYRLVYNTRHTYATVCLMNGLNPIYVASQLGDAHEVLCKVD